MWRETAAILLASSISPEFRARLSSLAGIPKRSDTMGIAIGNALDDIEWTKATEKFTKSARIFERQIVASGKIKENLPKKFVASMAFEAVDPRATLWADQHAAILVREITEETRSAIQKIILDALNGDYTIDDAGELVSRVIGLTVRQARAVENSYNATIENLVNDGMSRRSATARARELAKAYRERLILKRGEMIARTEIMRAANNGRLLSWAQAIDAGVIDPTMVKEWRTYPGYGANGPCPICLELRGVTVPVLSEFPNGALMPPGHPFCRCTAILVPPTRGLPRIAQVGGGYATPKIDPLGSELASEIRSNEVAKFNPNHDRRGRFSRAPSGSGGRISHLPTDRVSREFAARLAAGDSRLLSDWGAYEITVNNGSGKAANEFLDLTRNRTPVNRVAVVTDGPRIQSVETPKSLQRKFRPDERHTKQDLAPGLVNNVIDTSPRDTMPLKKYDSAEWVGESAGVRNSSYKIMSNHAEHKIKISDPDTQSLLQKDGTFDTNTLTLTPKDAGPRTDRLRAHNILLAGHRAKGSQPVLWRGVNNKLAVDDAGTLIKAGDTFDLGSASFSRDAIVAGAFAENADYSTIIRVAAGSRGVRAVPKKLETYTELSTVKHEQEVILQGRFRVLSISTIEYRREGKPKNLGTRAGQFPLKTRTQTVIEIEHLGTFDPITGTYSEGATVV